MLHKNCSCPEGWIDSSRRTPLVHDCDYIAERNKLIPQARVRAENRYRDLHPGGGGTVADHEVSRMFIEEMDRLWAERNRELRGDMAA